MDFRAQIEARQAAWIERRRDLHRHPELSFEETRTAGIVAAELERLGLAVQTGVGKTGVVGLLEGEAGGPTVMVRADIDALPVQEENQVEYASQVPGKMHACGHDGHTTIGLAVAELLSQCRSQIAGRVKFVFQPAEEIGQGANAMITDGALRDPVPDVTLGLHLWNELPIGTVALTDGPMMASESDITIRVHGHGGHGGMPHDTRDPILAGSQIICALQSIVSRNLNPIDSAVMSITYFQAGSTFTVIPPMAELRGTIRSYDPDVRAQVDRRLCEIAEGVAQALGCTADVTVQHNTTPVINSARVNNQLRRVFAEVAPDVKLIDSYRTMAAEDMAYFLDQVPGAFFLVGAANSDRGLDFPHHHPRFDFDEAVIPLAVRLMAAAVVSYVASG